MVLAWICGVAAGLASSDDSAYTAQPSASDLARRSGTFMFGAGCLLSAYAIASLLFIHFYRDNVQAERAFCTVRNLRYRRRAGGAAPAVGCSNE